VVGSQVLAVIPPGDGYGDQASESIPANSTLVFVIDILGVDKAAKN
jgi:peptidylprolyl isomerase